MSNISKAKKITAFVISAALALSMTACGEDTINCGVSNGSDVPSGLYIYYLLSAYYEAQSYMTENDTDVFAITIEDKNAAAWMQDTAVEDLKEYLAVEAKFDEYGLTLSDDDISAAKITVDNMWEYYGEVYEGYGISESSFLKAYQNNTKRDMLFDAIYGENGDREVPDEDIRAYLRDNYALINYIQMNLVDGEGNLLKSDGKAERMEMAKDYVERAKNGEDFDELNKEYTDYFDELKAEAEAAAEAAAAEIAEDDAEETTAASVEASDAEEEAPAETEAEVTEETTAETEAETEAVTEAETEEASEETTAAVWADDIEAETEAAETETSEEEETETTAADVSNKKVVKKDSETPDKTVVEKAFEMSAGDITIVEEDEFYYVLTRLDIFETDDYYESTKDSLLYEMRDDDFESLRQEWAESVDFTINSKAVERYTPQKFAETK